MQVNILWTGREYYSLENCLIDIGEGGSNINSHIVGNYQEKIYYVDYHIKTNSRWETLYCKIESWHSSIKEVIVLEKEVHDNWIMNGKVADQFMGCIDVDIPLTPFTNTLPVNRMKLDIGSQKDIKVIYLDVLYRLQTPVWQKYRRVSDLVFHYENIPNDFEAEILVDQLGLVVDYPSLFVRTAIAHTTFS
jgi:uncharacterized protein